MSEDSNELYYAHMEADRNEAEDAYFSARPSLGTDADKALFRAGFERAYTKLWNRARQLERENAELREALEGVLKLYDTKSWPMENEIDIDKIRAALQKVTP
jgi:hypothetical protein